MNYNELDILELREGLDYWHKRFLMADKRAKKWRRRYKVSEHIRETLVRSFSTQFARREDADLKRVGWKFVTMIILILWLSTMLIK